MDGIFNDRPDGLESGAPPAPAVVIVLGAFARAAVQPARAIYLRGDARRALVTRFFGLGGAEDPAGAGDPAGAALDCAALEVALHDVRTHENLLSAGWTAPRAVPVNLYVAADLGEEGAVGRLWPLAALLQQFAAADLMCQVFLLLNTGVFPSGSPAQDRARAARVAAGLRALRSLAGFRPAPRRRAARARKLPAQAAPPAMVFLFDHRKEGAAEVKDLAGMATLLGNGLLALLEGGTARLLLEALPRALDDSPAYHSIGAAALVYDPEAAQRVCARRAAAAFVETWLLAEPAAAQLQQQERLLARILAGLGDPPGWLAGLAAALPGEAGRVAPIERPLALKASLESLPFQALDFENLPAARWDGDLLAHAAYLHETLLPQAGHALEQEAGRLAAAAAGQARDAAQALLRCADLYPGGLRAAGQALASLQEKLLAYRGEVERAAAGAGAQPAAFHPPAAERLRAVIAGIPPLPWLFRWLPGSLRPRAAELYCLWRRRAWLRQMLDLRRQGLAELEAQYSRALTAAALGRLLAVAEAALEALNPAAGLPAALEQAALDALALVERALPVGEGSAQFQTAPRGGMEPQINPLPEDPFRLRAGSPGWLDAVYRRSPPNYAAWLADLLGGEALLCGGSAAGAEALAGWLQARGLEAFRCLWAYPVDRVMAEQGACPARFLEGQVTAALPPLRPDFDASGGGAGAAGRACLIGAPGWEACRLPPDAPPHWEVRYTGNPYLALWFQARGGIPAAAVEAALAG